MKSKKLLSRDEIKIDGEKSFNFYKDKTILVAGGAGSIGSQLVCQLYKYNPKKIIVVDNNESNVFRLSQKIYGYEQLIKVHLCDVTKILDLETLFDIYDIDFVFNAAAYKHVSIVETNIKNSLYNNLIGCFNLIEMSIKHRVDKFLQVSSDKAVNPTNIMGVSKRICELLCSFFCRNPNNTQFIITRFGNVIGSDGSVVPIFKSQIKKGGPITITDKTVERYFMTIKEACKLVIEATRVGKNNQTFIFDMGPPIKILDLAKKMILLSGVQDKIEIREIGLRPGEKLTEELSSEYEKPTICGKHLYVISGAVKNQKAINDLLLDFIDDLKNGIHETEILKIIESLVPEYDSKKEKQVK